MVEDHLVSDERSRMAANLLLLAPPCEFHEVYNDVRCLIGDDPFVQKKLFSAVAQYTRDQMLQIQLPDCEYPTLITPISDLGSGRYFCPRTKQSFTLDHFKLAANDVKPTPDEGLYSSFSDIEPWRRSLESNLTDYCTEHFKNGAVSVYSTQTADGRFIIACIESHFSKNQSTGRWRSEWRVSMTDKPLGTTLEVHGIIKVQTHLFEEGNVQLISSKESAFSLPGTSPEIFAKECTTRIRQADDHYQTAIGENFKSMSDSTFKALRRQLPLTRAKIDWNKIITYQIGNEIARPSNG